MRRLILTPDRLVMVPKGLTHTEFARSGAPDGLRLRDHGDIIQVHLEALLDQDAGKVETAVWAAFGRVVRIEWYA